MKVCVTGAGGFIGSHLVDRLVEQKHEVTAIDRKPLGEWSGVKWESRNWATVVASNGVALLNDDYKVIYHLAADPRIQPSFDAPVETFYNNANETLAVLESAKKIGAKVIYAGSSTADWDEYANPYAHSKLEGERLCMLYRRIYGVPTVITRFYNVYGPRQIEEGELATVIGIWEKAHREGEKFVVTGSGLQRRDLTHVDDICMALTDLAESHLATTMKYVGIGVGVNYAILDLAREFAEHDESRIVYEPRRPGEAPETLNDPAPLHTALRWKPADQILEYVRSIVAKAPAKTG